MSKVVAARAEVLAVFHLYVPVHSSLHEDADARLNKALDALQAAAVAEAQVPSPPPPVPPSAAPPAPVPVPEAAPKAGPKRGKVATEAPPATVAEDANAGKGDEKAADPAK